MQYLNCKVLEEKYSLASQLLVEKPVSLVEEEGSGFVDWNVMLIAIGHIWPTSAFLEVMEPLSTILASTSSFHGS